MSKPLPVALITGAAKRIGAALARAFAQAGWRVVIHCRHSLQSARRLAATLGEANAAVLSADLTQSGAAERLIAEAAAQWGRLDLLVNNASTYRRTPLDDLDEENLRQDFEANFFAPFALMRAFAARRRPGAILNLLDARIARPDAGSAGYTLAKQSLADATLLAARAWARHGIRVNAIAPGFVRPADGVPLARMARLLRQVPLGRRTTEAELAAAALYLAAAPNLTGQILYVDGGLHLPDGDLGEKTP